MSNVETPRRVGKLLLVFDFDLTLTDADTDRYGPEVLAPKLRQRMEDLAPTWQWTDLVADTYRQIHAQGITRDQIEDAQRILPFHPAMKRALVNIKQRYGSDVVLFILSNSNEVFIDVILRHHGLRDLFDVVVTNRAHFDDAGLLVIQRRVDPHGPQHDCHVGCSPNMCKGAELSAWLERHGGMDAFWKIVYSGDGSNDLCPILRLRASDVAFVRLGHGLAPRIAKEGEALGLKASRLTWNDAWQAEILFDAL